MRKLFRRSSHNSTSSDNIFVKNEGEITTEWPGFDEEEGQLSLDVYQTDEAVVIKSTIAGALPADIEISLAEGMLTIKGHREPPEQVPVDAYMYRECYWGRFSRSIILPIEVRSDKVSASLHNGVLTIILPKIRRLKSTMIKVDDEADED